MGAFSAGIWSIANIANMVNTSTWCIRWKEEYAERDRVSPLNKQRWPPRGACCTLHSGSLTRHRDHKTSTALPPNSFTFRPSRPPGALPCPDSQPTLTASDCECVPVRALYKPPPPLSPPTPVSPQPQRPCSVCAFALPFQQLHRNLPCDSPLNQTQPISSPDS